MTDLSSWSSLMGSIVVAAVAFYAIRANNDQAAHRAREDWYRKNLIEHAGPFLAEMNAAKWQLADSYEHYHVPNISDREINTRASEALDTAIWKVNAAATMLQLSCSLATKNKVGEALSHLHKASGALKGKHQYSHYADESVTNGPKYKLFAKATKDFEDAERAFLDARNDAISQIEKDLAQGPGKLAATSSPIAEFASRNLSKKISE